MMVATMHKRWFAIAVVGALAAPACSKKTDDASGTGATGGTKSAEGPSGSSEGGMPAEWKAWMPANAQGLWDGAWASRLTLRTSGTMSMAGDPAAMEIKGGTAKVFDGKQEHELGFAVDSPCSVAFKQTITEGSMKGGTATHAKQFVVKNGALLVGEGGAGYRKGKTAFVCTSGMDKVFTVDETGCKVWKDSFGKLESKPGECAWTSEGGKDVLTLGKGDWATKVVADGDVLTSDQFDRYVKEGLHEKAASYDEAKTKITAKVKENDPGEQAKAAGGKVGDTKTVVGLHATYAADKASLDGKPLEITGQYYGNSSSTSNGVTTHGASIIDGKDSSKFSITCWSKDDQSKGLKQYDKVTAKGTVKDFLDKPSLENCTLAKAK